MAIALFSCTPKNTEISGTLINYKGKNIKLEYNNNSEEIEVQADGTFSASLPLPKDSYLTLRCGRKQLKTYVIAGKELIVNFNLENQEKTFYGESKAICEYLQKKETLHKMEWYRLEEKEFLQKLDSLNELRKNILLKQTFKEDFNAKELLCMEYETYTFVLNYVPYHGYYAEGEYVPGKIITEHCKNAVFNQVDLLNLPEYRKFINLRATERGYTRSKAQEGLNMTMESAIYISDLKAHPEIKSYMIYSLVKPYVERNGTGEDIYTQLHTILTSLCADSEKLGEIEKLAVKWDKIAKGQASPSFSLKDINGETVSLNDLRGKYVYIDVWATWCGPCLGEIPHLMKLEKEMHDKDVAFVSISTDRNKEQWENFVRKKEMGGIQLINDSSCSFCKDYMIFGIPRFILLDKEGKIIDNNAPRPSGKIKEVLQELMG